MKRINNESINDYLNKFRQTKSRCITQTPKHELVRMASTGLEFSIRKKLVHISHDYDKSVEEFIKFAQHNFVSVENRVRIKCPCVNCLNERRLNVVEIREHLLCDGFLKNYTTWTWHGELLDMLSLSETHEYIHWTMGDKLEDMIHDVGVQSNAEAVYENMSTDIDTLLCPGSTKFT